MTANCQDGQRYAFDNRIATSRDVESAVRQNPAFAERYEHDVAFRMGVDSAVWAVAHGQSKELLESLPPAISSKHAEVRG
jgi:hypothetical protein